MCGILALLYSSAKRYEPMKVTNGMSRLEARGPEGTKITHLESAGVFTTAGAGAGVFTTAGAGAGVFTTAGAGAGVFTTAGAGATFGFTRLAINGLHEGGMQPFDSNYASWMCNGEIYNFKHIESRFGYVSKGSDCEVLGYLWNCLKDPVAFCRALDGVFCVVLYDKEDDSFLIARDPYGVRPLYWAHDTFYGTSFASERKVLEEIIEPYSKIYEFPPGEVWTVKSGVCVKKVVYHTVPWLKGGTNSLLAEHLIRQTLLTAVEKRLLTERPVAALLSGGLDSSLIASIVQKLLVERGLPPLKTFSIGMTGSSDLAYARKVANWIGSEHHELVVSADEMFSCIPDVIRDIESYDITTVRASVGNWMIAREIRRTTDCKVVFNGDGSDEVWGSYLYFYKAPNDFAFEADSQRLLSEIHRYDVLRSDRSISSHGLEARTPFLDKQFVGVAMSLPTELRRPNKCENRMEKHFLRESFSGDLLLPEEVLWRRKEAFSDGVSSQEKSWFQEIQERILEGRLVPKNWKEMAEEFKEPRPKTPEAFYYRMIYENFFTKTGDYWPFWMPRWSPETSDPSARTLNSV